ncbi:MAG: trp operon repressor [Holosporaceae bacterium]|jgi:TrpR-related protein YerC/YecD|nr:trp operon repressor [Holosporaceae bacterium]
MKPEHDDDEKNEVDLFEVFPLISTADEAKNFLMDLCTPSEINAFVERWKVCQLLNRQTFSYRRIKDLTGASLTTIGRVARFLRNESYGGYDTMLKKIGERK